MQTLKKKRKREYNDQEEQLQKKCKYEHVSPPAPQQQLVPSKSQLIVYNKPELPTSLNSNSRFVVRQNLTLRIPPLLQPPKPSGTSTALIEYKPPPKLFGASDNGVKMVEILEEDFPCVGQMRKSCNYTMENVEEDVMET